VTGTRGEPSAPLADATASTWWLYVVECVDGSLYTGITVDLERRYAQHCRGKAAAYTRSRPPVRLLGAMAAANRSSALKLEYAFKQLSSREKRVRATTMGIPAEIASAFACR